MGRLFFLFALSIVSIVSLARPWIGVVAAYLVAILTPQAVWYWNFGDLRPVIWIMVPTCIGFLIALLRGDYVISRLLSSRILFLLTLWVCFVISYFVGPYTDVAGPFRFADPQWALSVFNKMFLLCLMACLVIDEARKVWILTWVVALSGAYLVYWANDQYLSGHFFGRLAGPVDVYGVGSYADENQFAMLFVVLQPFLWYLGQSVKHKWLRWSLWLIIPFTWHAVFLTGSRGGLIGLAVTLAVMAIRSKHRVLSLLLIPAFLVVYQWQAGETMKERAGTIEEYATETSAATRLEAWHAAVGMIAAHPVSGVGLASFGVAFPDFSDKKPREAHNTFFQIAAESGVVAGMMYLLLGFGSVIALWRNGKRLKTASPGGPDARLYFINEAVLCGMCGFVVCALFLSLQMAEIFFCLCALVHAVLLISRESGALELPDSTVRFVPLPAGGHPRRLPRSGLAP
ncbi:MAG: O-antigen polymerase [Gammaproteobacteria bacterium]|nr:O-antigen polymerase [Gammaproteobacteria bacterium]